MRNFGTIKFDNSEKNIENKLKTLGEDPLNTKLKSKDQIDEYIKNLKKQRNHKKNIGEILLNQKLISGVGNYIRAMALYDAKISPYRELKDMSDMDIKRLYENISKIMKKSYNKQKRSGLHTYKLYVYRQKQSPKGKVITVSEMPKGRSMYWSKDEQN